jgi:hypothetical protein
MEELSSVNHFPTPSDKNDRKFLISLKFMNCIGSYKEACERLGVVSIRVESELKREREK